MGEQGESWSANFVYGAHGELVSQTWSGGLFDGLAVSNRFDHLLRRTNVAVLDGAAQLSASGYAFDAASRLSKVTSGVNSASYSYLANAPLVSQIAFTNNGSWRMTTSKQFDQLNRLQSMASVASTFTAAGFEYTYNNANQRTERREADGVYWRFGYDSLGQVTSGKKYWADGIPVAGQQFEYAFDDIGNRTSAKGGGDASGSNLRTSAYYPNALNQYWSNTVPGAVDVMGVALATNSVTVNGQVPYRKGEYFRKELAVNNTAAPVWQQITVAAPNEATVTRHEFVAQTPQVFVHDDDGNLVSDGRWTYTWDGENRLVAMAARTGVGPQISLKFEYDTQGRRIRKQVWGNAAWSGSATNDLRFVYDGWNLIAVLSPQSTVLRSFTWGLDLSGSLQGAGGVGGLLMLNDTANGVHYPAFDGNGNVAALVKSDGTLSAQYEYGPFGELLRATGPMAKANPFRFSTKYQDDEIGLLYYGYRYYDPSTGRWNSRDPMNEEAGLSLYGAVGNDPVGHFDKLGLQYFPQLPWPTPPYPEHMPPPWWPPDRPYPTTPSSGRSCCCRGKVIDGTPVVVFRVCRGKSPGGGWDHGWIEMSDGGSAGFYPKANNQEGSQPGGIPFLVPGQVDIPESDHYRNHSDKECTDFKASPCDVNIDTLRGFIWGIIWRDKLNPPKYDVSAYNCFHWAMSRFGDAHTYVKHRHGGGCGNDPHEWE